MLKEVRASLYNKNGQSKLNIALNVIIVFVILVLACEIYFTVNYSGVYIVDGSMRPTLIGADSENVIGGDYVYIDKHAKPDYGDIVVVDHPSKCLIKRVIAFGKDRIKLVKGQLWLWKDGEDGFKEVNETYLSTNVEYNDPNDPDNTFYNTDDGYLVPEGHFFLMGDNRNYSKDSRHPEIGSVPLKYLDGVVTDWSIKHKSFITSFYNFFTFQLPSAFGIK